MIKQLSKQVAQDLCAQQVITSICDCVKELVDNSIDAGAKRIEIYLEEYGKQMVRVKDDGHGIDIFEFLAQKGSTSKNKGNYQEVQTLGFRGQALHSIAKVSQKMIIISCSALTKKTTKYNVKENRNEQISSTRDPGTMVEIYNLFQYLPVRRYELLNKYKQFLKKIDEMVKQYCMIFPGISFIIKNTREGQVDILLETGSHTMGTKDQNWKERIKEMLGTKISQSLMYFKTAHLEGWILKNIESGSSKDNTFIRKTLHFAYLNTRPIDPLAKISTVLDQYYKKYSRSTKYIDIINIVLPWTSYDVNLAPNKRDILIKQVLVQKIIQQLKAFIQKNVVQSVPDLRQFQENEKNKMKNKMEQFMKTAQTKIQKFPQNNQEVEEKRKPAEHKPLQAQRSIKQIGQRQLNRPIIGSKNKIIQSLNQRMMSSKPRPMIKNEQLKQPNIQKPKSIANQSPKVEQKPKVQQKCSIEKLEEQIIPQNLSCTIEKQSFKQFKVLGQFNHGFIVCQHKDKYYLVDQHAASQKFHFQKLLQSARNRAQLCDKIQLNHMEIETLNENRTKLQADGYKFSICENNSILLHEGPTFLNKVYGKQYFLDAALSGKNLSELPDFYNAAATKACRTAVMVGDVLQSVDMKNIVMELSSLRSPWNCPHGRPTLIFLGSKEGIHKNISCKDRQYCLGLQ